jgi:hypothetical protein
MPAVEARRSRREPETKCWIIEVFEAGPGAAVDVFTAFGKAAMQARSGPDALSIAKNQRPAHRLPSPAGDIPR